MASTQPVPAGASPVSTGAGGVLAAMRPGPGEARSAPVGGQPAGGAAHAANAAGAGSALVPSSPPLGEGESEAGFGPLAARLPVELDVAAPVREFRVRHLLALEPGTVIESQWHHGNDLPLAAGDVRLAWSEFEVIETRLAVRVTRLV